MPFLFLLSSNPPDLSPKPDILSFAVGVNSSYNKIK